MATYRLASIRLIQAKRGPCNADDAAAVDSVRGFRLDETLPHIQRLLDYIEEQRLDWFGTATADFFYGLHQC
jgi:hypothetical protein